MNTYPNVPIDSLAGDSPAVAFGKINANFALAQSFTATPVIPIIAGPSTESTQTGTFIGYLGGGSALLTVSGPFPTGLQLGASVTDNSANTIIPSGTTVVGINQSASTINLSQNCGFSGFNYVFNYSQSNYVPGVAVLSGLGDPPYLAWEKINLNFQALTAVTGP